MSSLQIAVGHTKSAYVLMGMLYLYLKPSAVNVQGVRMHYTVWCQAWQHAEMMAIVVLV